MPYILNACRVLIQALGLPPDEATGSLVAWLGLRYRDGRAEALALLDEAELAAWHRLGRIESCHEDDIRSSGYTVHTLEAAAWSFLTTESYEEAVVRAANLGEDADTVAAVCGALAGAYYGYAAIPERWRKQLQAEARIREIALALGRHADATPG